VECPWRAVLDGSSGVLPDDGNLSVAYKSVWAPPDLADDWLSRLSAELPWSQPEIQIFGRRIPVPRLQVWMGDPEAHYRYSGLDNQPLPWAPLVQQIRARVEATCRTAFNSVLINLYRNGRDSNGWHSDDERELGKEPVIASVSLGATRRFLIRRREDHGDKRELALEHGSLLLMGGRTQAEWQHTIPKELRVDLPRINLTFRLVRP
jgi:alkylated DNA repair dioxygenase AlkB